MDTPESQDLDFVATLKCLDLVRQVTPTASPPSTTIDLPEMSSSETERLLRIFPVLVGQAADTIAGLERTSVDAVLDRWERSVRQNESRRP